MKKAEETFREFDDPAAVGIDPGLTSAGFCALGKRGTPVFYRTIGTDPNYGPISERYLYLANRLSSNLMPSDAVFMEDYAYNVSKGSLPTMGEVGAVIKLTSLRITGAWPIIVTTQQIRKWLSGVVNLPNHELTKELLKRYKVDTKSKDIAVAYTLADLGYHYLRWASGDTLGISKERLGILEKISARNVAD